MGNLLYRLKLRNINLAILSLLLTSLLVLNGCSKPVEGKIKDEKSTFAKADTDVVEIPVHADYPERADISSYFETTTRVQAENRVDVMAKGIGECLSVLVDEGDMVTTGQVLATLDKTELDAQVRQTRVNVEQQRVTMVIAQKSLEEGIGSQIERDNARFAFEQAVAALDIQEVQLDNLTVTAPISGVITTKHIQQGMMVSSGMPTFSIVDTRSFILPINPPEKELQNLSVGQKALVTIDSVKDRQFETKVTKINPSVDPISGTVKVTLEFKNEEKELLREASFARVKLIMSTHENTLIVPKDALLEENARKYIMVIREEGASAEDDEAQGDTKLFAKRVEVTTGLEDSSSVEVTEGLKDDQLIITLGQHTLKDGAQVVITNAEEQILSLKDLTEEEALEQAKTKKYSGNPDKHSRKILRR